MKTFARPTSSRFRLEASLFWTLLAVLFLPYIFCFPVSLSPGSDFYSVLYANSSASCPLLPKASEDSYLKVKINSVCNSQSQSSSSSPNSPCQALSRLFPKLCKLSSDDPTVSSKVNGSVDLIKVNSLGLGSFCVKLVEAYQNVSRSAPDEWISPFQSDGAGGDKTACEGSCQNMKVKDLREDDKFDLSAECILLLEGYRIYQEGKKLSAKMVNVPSSLSSPSPRPEDKLFPVPDSEIKPISADKGGNNKSSKLGVAQGKPEEAQSLTNVVLHQREGVSDNSVGNPKPTTGPTSSVFGKVNLDGGEVKPNHPDKRTEVAAPSSSTGKANVEAIPDSKTGPPVFSGISGKPLGIQPASSSSSPSSTTSTTTTTTAASIDTNIEDGPLPPIEAAGDAVAKIKSSTASSIPIIINNAEKKPETVTATAMEKPKKEEVKTPEPEEDDKTGLEVVDNTKDEKSKVPSSSPKKVVVDPEAELPADDYIADSGEQLDDPDKYPPPSKTEVERPNVVVPNADGGKNFDSKRQPTKIQSQNIEGGMGNIYAAGNGRMSLMPYEGRGTTINVSLNESEDTGFFSYFLFCATLAGLMYVVFHNKKKLIAYVVEGRRPQRSRSRRPSASSQYRRLEQNFD